MVTCEIMFCVCFVSVLFQFYFRCNHCIKATLKSYLHRANYRGTKCKNCYLMTPLILICIGFIYRFGQVQFWVGRSAFAEYLMDWIGLKESTDIFAIVYRKTTCKLSLANFHYNIYNLLTYRLLLGQLLGHHWLSLFICISHRGSTDRQKTLSPNSLPLNMAATNWL